MFNLFGHIAESGLDSAVKAFRCEITPLEWVEILFAFPKMSGDIPFETWNAEAWTVAIRHGAITPDLASRIPWDIISKANRRRLLKKWPGLSVPDTPARPGIDEKSRIIRVNPFERYYFHAVEPDTGEDVCDCLKIYGVVGSLRGDYDGPFLTCGCGEPGCSGFWEQRSHLSPAFVHWSIEQYERKLELYFDRDVYEQGALSLLRRKHLAKWNGSEGYNDSYRNFAEFDAAVQRLLSDNPRLNEIWERAKEAGK